MTQQTFEANKERKQESIERVRSEVKHPAQPSAEMIKSAQALHSFFKDNSHSDPEEVLQRLSRQNLLTLSRKEEKKKFDENGRNEQPEEKKEIADLVEADKKDEELSVKSKDHNEMRLQKIRKKDVAESEDSERYMTREEVLERDLEHAKKQLAISEDKYDSLIQALLLANSFRGESKEGTKEDEKMTFPQWLMYILVLFLQAVAQSGEEEKISLAEGV